MSRLTDIAGTMLTRFRVGRASLVADSMTAARAHTLQDKAGVLAHTVDAPQYFIGPAAPGVSDFGRAIINGDRWFNTGNGIEYTRVGGAWMDPSAASAAAIRYVPARLSNGTASPIPLNADGSIPAKLSNGTVSNIPTQA